MSRASFVLAVLLLKVGSAQQPTYSDANIVNASDYSTGPFAPNSVLTIFGSNLSWYTHALASSDIVAETVPGQMANVAVYIDNRPAPLLYVSPTQINFLVPGNEISGDVPVRVVRQGVWGPEARITLVDAAPALFDIGNGFAIATHGEGSLLTEDSPAQPAEIVVIYATGLGATQPNPSPGQIPQSAAPLLLLDSLTVSLDGRTLPSFRIKYAGATPLSAGLYQINLEMPPETGPDPLIQVAVGNKADSGGLKLAFQPAAK